MATAVLAAVATLHMILPGKHKKPVLFVKEWFFFLFGLPFLLFHKQQQQRKTNP